MYLVRTFDIEVMASLWKRSFNVESNSSPLGVGVFGVSQSWILSFFGEPVIFLITGGNCCYSIEQDHPTVKK